MKKVENTREVKKEYSKQFNKKFYKIKSSANNGL